MSCQMGLSQVIRYATSVDFKGDRSTFSPIVDERLKSRCKREKRRHITMSQRPKRGHIISMARRLRSLILICQFVYANTGFSQSVFLKVQPERSVGRDSDPRGRSLPQHTRSHLSHQRHHQRRTPVTFLVRTSHISSRGKVLQKTVLVNLAAWVVLVGGVLTWSCSGSDPEQGNPVLENPGLKSFLLFQQTPNEYM